MAISGKRMRLGEILIKAGILTEDQLNHGLAKQQHTREPIGEILIQLGYVTEEQIKHALELQYGVKSYSLKSKLPAELMRLIPESMMKQHKILPVSISQMTVAMVDPGNILALDDLRLRFKGVSIQPVVITEAEFRDVVKNLPREAVVPASEGHEEERQEAPSSEEQTASQLAQAVLGNALRHRATEIILEPQEFETWVRMRINGALHKEPSIPTRVASALVSRFKVMAELSLTAGNVPQVGTIKTRHEGRAVNIFLRSLPVRHGQMLNLRLFDHALVEGISVDGLVEQAVAAEAIKRLVASKSGLVLVNGTKHSGKATLIHAMLGEALKEHRSVISFGQLPFDLDGVSQVPVDAHHPENTLAQIFEQGPDLVAVPSLTEPDLARKLVHGALSGHSALVGVPTAQRFLHQLADLCELSPRAIANSVAGVVNVRLVRRLCGKCKIPFRPDDQTAAFFRPYNESGMLYRAVGCPECGDTGFAGQVGIYGVIPFDAQLRQMVATGATQSAIETHAKQRGHLMLYDYAAWAAAQGLTTLEELAKTDLFDRVMDGNP